MGLEVRDSKAWVGSFDKGWRVDENSNYLQSSVQATNSH